MSKKHPLYQKHRRPGKRLAARGIAAVCGCALLLTVVILLVARPGSEAEPFSAAQTEPVGVPETTVSNIPKNPYGPEDFSYEGAYLTCTAAEAVLGVDVSEHQHEIDWQQVADSGVKFAMIRLGYQGTTSGGVYTDEYALRNLQGALDAGLQVGAYFFSQAVSVREAAEQAAFCIAMLKDYEITMPVVFDWEYTGDDTRTADMTPEMLLACTKTFCDAVEAAGYETMLYFNAHLADTLLDLEQLYEYPFWLAMYTDQMDYPHAFEMWQYTADGTVPGIEGSTDLNLWLPG